MLTEAQWIAGLRAKNAAEAAEIERQNEEREEAEKARKWVFWQKACEELRAQGLPLETKVVTKETSQGTPYVSFDVVGHAISYYPDSPFSSRFAARGSLFGKLDDAVAFVLRLHDVADDVADDVDVDEPPILPGCLQVRTLNADHLGEIQKEINRELVAIDHIGGFVNETGVQVRERSDGGYYATISYRWYPPRAEAEVA